MELEISKRYYSYGFHPMTAKFYEGIGGIQAVTLIGNRQNFEKLKTAGRRAKRMKIRDSGSLVLHYVGYFSYPSASDWCGLIRCTLQNFLFYDFQNTTPTIFIEFPSKFIQGIIFMGRYRLLLLW